jgi:hypothetical protein
VEAGATSIVAGKITDERGNTSLCGVAAPVYVPSSQVEVVGAINMQGHALTGLPVPSAGTDAARRDMGGATLQNLGAPVNANDAARKAYVDSKVAGFGISQIAIDADKNWNGKNITNVGEISGLAFTPTISKMRFVHLPDPEKAPENVVASDLSEVSTYSTGFILAKTFPPAPTMGYVSHDISAVTVSMEIGYTGSQDAGEVDIRVNGVSKKVLIGPTGGWGERSAVIPISPGDVITLWLRTENENQQGQLRNAKIYSMRHPLAVPSVAW